MVVRKNDVLMGDGQGLTDGELIKACRATNILNACQFRNGIIRKTATIDFAERMGRGEQDMEFLGDFSVYLRAIGSHLRDEFGENNTRWENADTYDRTRRIPHRGKYGDKGRRNDPCGGGGGGGGGDSREIIGIIKEGLIALLVEKCKTIMRIITMAIREILITHGVII